METTLATKTCSMCGQSKPLSDFHRNSHHSDGRRSRCKLCTYKEQGEYRATPEGRRKSLAIRRAWGDKNRERERQRERDRHAALSPDERRAKRRQKLERNAVQERARQLLNNAVIAGQLIRPNNCSRCGEPCTPHGHHEDYSKPLDVMWLCFNCHGLRHREIFDLEAARTAEQTFS